MKKSFLFAGVLLFTALSILSALRLQEEKVEIISPLLAHVHHPVDEGRHFTFDVLISSHETHHLLPEAVEEVRLRGADETVLPLVLEDIRRQESVRLDGEAFHRYEIEVSPRLLFSEGAVKIEEANLELVYATHPPLTVPVGSFAYAQKTSAPSCIDLRSLRNVVGDLGAGTTSLGFIALLENATDERVCVEEITIHAANIHVDAGSLLFFDEDKGPFVGVDDLIGDYDHLGEAETGSFCIGPHERTRFFAPFVYERKEERLYRYPLKIVHDSEAGGGVLFVEDFPFIRTDPFHESSQGGLRRVFPD